MEIRINLSVAGFDAMDYGVGTYRGKNSPISSTEKGDES